MREGGVGWESRCPALRAFYQRIYGRLSDTIQSLGAYTTARPLLQARTPPPNNGNMASDSTSDRTVSSPPSADVRTRVSLPLGAVATVEGAYNGNPSSVVVNSGTGTPCVVPLGIVGSETVVRASEEDRDLTEQGGDNDAV